MICTYNRYALVDTRAKIFVDCKLIVVHFNNTGEGTVIGIISFWLDLQVCNIVIH